MKQLIKSPVWCILLLSVSIAMAGCKTTDDPGTPDPVGIKSISLDNKNIHVTGAVDVFRNPEKLFYKRFTEEVLNAADDIRMFTVKKALATSGISLQFKTRSSFVHLTFSPEPGFGEQGSFKILKDGEDFKTVAFDKKDAKTRVDVHLNSLPTDKESVYEVILPSFSNMSLTGFEIDGSSDLIAYEPEKKQIYFSFGDSITHGRGQDGASYLTYPYLLSKQLDMTLYNLSIGGSRVSIPVAEMSKDLPEADVITVLVGYNDLNGGGHSTERFEKDSRRYLSTIRQYQPGAKIFAITLLYTEKKRNPRTGLTPDDFREVIRKVVREYQEDDDELYLVEGEELTSPANLRGGKDPVHLSVEGAALFADELYLEMTKNL